MRKLTVLVWLAADTGRVTGDLREAMRQDVREIDTAGETDEMGYAVAYDDGDTEYWRCSNGPSSTSNGHRNMASLSNLIDWIDWSVNWCPAESYALIIGGHGSGIARDTETYRGGKPRLIIEYADPLAIEFERVQREKDTPDASWNGMDGALWAGDVPSLRDHIADTSKKVNADLAYDDGSRQAMSIVDLGMACRHLASKGPLAVVLLDACYMASVEVAEELMGAAATLVASPEPVPAEGFDYTRLLQGWQAAAKIWGTDEPGWPQIIAVRAAGAFEDAHDKPDADPRTRILALDLTRMQELLDAMDGVGDRMMEVLHRSWLPDFNDFLHTSDTHMAYLAMWLRRLPLASEYMDERVETAIDLLSAAIISEWSADGEGHGMSVYLPERGPVEEWYTDTAISKRPWGQMVAWAVRA